MKKPLNKQELLKDLSRAQIRYKPRSKTPARTLIKSVEKQGRNSNTPTSLLKYQSYLKFIHQDKLTHKKKYSFSKEESKPILINLSKTPNLNRQFAPYLERGRLSLAEKRRSPAREMKYALDITKDSQHHKPRKLSISKDKRNKKLKSKDMDTSKSRLDMEEEKAQKLLFDGIQFFRDLGKGAHALVRSAVDWKQNRKVAVKIYNKAEIDSEQKTNIEREINILQSIRHPNIAALYDVIETPKTINLMMEYGGGNSLYQHMRSRTNGLFSQQEAKPLFKQIFEAIAYLHSKNIVHRDIKPENILLNKTLHVKLIDFGFSLISKTNQRVDTFCGTPTYMAPQIVNKKKHVGMYADRWSLGVLLYTVLQGIYPFRATHEKQLFAKISKGDFDFIIELSEEVTNLIQQFLKMRPEQRLSPSDALNSKWFQSVGDQRIYV